MRTRSILLLLPIALVVTPHVFADDDAKATVRNVVQSAGGEGNILKLFRMKERLNVSANPDAKGSERVSVLEPPEHWWLGKTDRVKEQMEPATYLVWAWTMGALVDPKSKIETVPDVTENDQPAFGLRIGATINPPLEMYFGKTDNRLVRIDWRSDIHRFSDWKEHDGFKYPAKVVGYKKNTGKPWYFTEILEIERLSELPAGLPR